MLMCLWEESLATRACGALAGMNNVSVFCIQLPPGM
jgi:hypothetical protein